MRLARGPGSSFVIIVLLFGVCAALWTDRPGAADRTRIAELEERIRVLEESRGSIRATWRGWRHEARTKHAGQDFQVATLWGFHRQTPPR